MSETAWARAPVLRALSLVLTERCNLDCAYCYRPRLPLGEAAASREGETMSPALARAAIDALLAGGARRPTLLFTGGEPLLAYPILQGAIRHARRVFPRERGLRIVLNTNGLLLTDAMFDFLDEQRVEIQLSFDGVAGAQDLRDPGGFGRLDALLLGLRRDRPRFFRRNLTIAMTIGPETIPSMTDSVRHFLMRRVRRLLLGPVFLRRTDTGSGIVPQLDEAFHETALLCLHHLRDTGETPVTLFRRPSRGGREDGERDLLCAAGAGECLAVGPGGEVSICPVILSGERPATVPKSEIETCLRIEASHGTSLRARHGMIARHAAMARRAAASGIFRREGKRSIEGACSSCDARVACWACPASILLDADHEDADRIPDFQCRFYQAAWRHRARFLERVGPRFGDGFRDLLRSAGVG